MINSAHSPQWADAAHTAINLRIVHSEYGDIPFSAMPTDSEQHGVDLFNAAVAGTYGPIAAYVAPPVVIPTEVTMRQARLALLAAGLLPTINAAVAAMSGTAGDAARIEWEFAKSVNRNQPLVTQLATALNLTSAQLDALFTAAAAL